MSSSPSSKPICPAPVDAGHRRQPAEGRAPRGERGADRPELANANRILAEEAAARSMFQQSVANERTRGDRCRGASKKRSNRLARPITKPTRDFDLD
jgi:hypothetical protein